MDLADPRTNSCVTPLLASGFAGHLFSYFGVKLLLVWKAFIPWYAYSQIANEFSVITARWFTESNALSKLKYRSSASLLSYIFRGTSSRKRKIFWGKIRRSWIRAELFRACNVVLRVVSCPSNNFVITLRTILVSLAGLEFLLVNMRAFWLAMLQFCHCYFAVFVAYFAAASDRDYCYLNTTHS